MSSRCGAWHVHPTDNSVKITNVTDLRIPVKETETRTLQFSARTKSTV